MPISANKKKIAMDMLLNIVATAIPTFVLQLLLLPKLAGHMSDDAYGLLVTILALLNVVPATMGNTLNNVRLIMGEKADSYAAVRNYNVLLLLMAGVNLLAVGFFSYYYEHSITLISLSLTLTVSVLWLLREYYLVAFRIRINYFHITISNIIMVLGYGVGYGVFLALGHWQFIYLFGHLFSLIYIFRKSELWREPLKVDRQFKPVSVQTTLLFLAGMLTRITTYADKMLVFPILGGAAVSVYYAATLFGKIVSMVITPVSGVMLSYLAKYERKNDSLFRLTLLVGSGLCIVGYASCVAISRPVLALLYPQFVDDAMQLIWLTTGTMVLTALISLLNPFVLKFFDMKWQIVINGIYALVYIGLSMSLLGVWGLKGFCVGALAATGMKLGFTLVIYRRGKQRES